MSDKKPELYSIHVRFDESTRHFFVDDSSSDIVNLKLDAATADELIDQIDDVAPWLLKAYHGQEYPLEAVIEVIFPWRTVQPFVKREIE